VDRSERHEQQGGEGKDCEFVHDCFPWIFFSSPSSVYSTNERSLSAPCPTFDPGELTPSNCDKQSGTSSSINSKYVNMWDPFDFFDSPESHRKPFRLPLRGNLGVLA
jgi:hypothetical protein